MQSARIALTGITGAGKDTLAVRLAAWAGEYLQQSSPIPIIGSGAQLRRPAEELIQMGVPAEEAPTIYGKVDQGLMISPEIVHLVLGAGLADHDNYILVGFPRGPGDSAFLNGLKNPPNIVITLVAHPDCIRGRAADRRVAEDGTSFSIKLDQLDPEKPLHPQTKEPLKMRKDDELAVVNRRIKLFETSIKPATQEFLETSKGDLITFTEDTTRQTRDQVFISVRQRLTRALGHH